MGPRAVPEGPRWCGDGDSCDLPGCNLEECGCGGEGAQEVHCECDEDCPCPDYCPDGESNCHAKPTKDCECQDNPEWQEGRCDHTAAETCETVCDQYTRQQTCATVDIACTCGQGCPNSDGETTPCRQEHWCTKNPQKPQTPWVGSCGGTGCARQCAGIDCNERCGPLCKRADAQCESVAECGCCECACMSCNGGCGSQQSHQELGDIGPYHCECQIPHVYDAYDKERIGYLYNNCPPGHARGKLACHELCPAKYRIATTWKHYHGQVYIESRWDYGSFCDCLYVCDRPG